MKRISKWVVGLALAGALVFVVAVNLMAPAPKEQALDYSLAIDLGGGRVTTLKALLAAGGDVEQGAEALVRPEGRETETPRARGLIDVGLNQLARGRPEHALAVWRAVPEDDPDYARAQRFIAHKIYAREFRRPGQGVAYVNRSLWTDPLSGNVWQDAVRIYGGALLERLR